MKNIIETTTEQNIDKCVAEIGCDSPRVRSVIKSLWDKDNGGGLYSYFREANFTLSVDHACEIFENPDLKSVFKAIDLSERLLSHHAPCLTLEDLKITVGGFAYFLTEQEDSIIKNGCPDKLYAISRRDPDFWFDYFIGSTYDIRGDSSQDITALPHQETLNITDLRRHLLKLKECVMSELYDCLSTGEAEHIRVKCFTLIKHMLRLPNIIPCFLADMVYPRYDERERLLYTESTPGGLSDILYVIGYIEKEMTIGTFAEVSKCLPKIDIFKANGGSEYYDLVKNYGLRKVNRAIDIYSQLRKKESLFWVDYLKTAEDMFCGLCLNDEDLIKFMRSIFGQSSCWIRRYAALDFNSIEENDEPVEFHAWNNYRTVQIGNNKEIHLNKRQAAVIQVLHEAYLEGCPGMDWNAIYDEICKLPEFRDDKDYAPVKMSAVFRGKNRYKQDTLIRWDDKKKLYELNLPKPRKEV